ncbi:ABC transporter ATP-binding protein [Natrononativus amylolyticus]|uniref:ABC transporter ATP-binding protein n=1 Tax=Natrononativus amylolyticus TaxID=2963434 RepID=UPI0020CBDC7F|nr:ABC transporter ATP-binding protein [Natrononativus amylolyticus]
MSDDTAGSATPDPLLVLEDVDAGYGETQVLRELSMSVGRGEIVSLIGRNGAGKTTTLRSIVGTIAPTAGTISYDGTDVTGWSSTKTAQLGISLVPEERRIFPELTVRENLRLASYGGSDDNDGITVEEALGMFENLEERQDNDGSALSGGEQQMLAIARALVGGADCILLDEPTEGLAPFIVQDVVDIVRELNERGITVLLVEQNVHVALDLADRHYVLNQGEIVYHGTSADLEEDQDVLDRYLGVTA